MAAPAPARRSALAPPPAPPAPLDPPLPPRRRSPLLAVCPFILGNELCERLAFYGLSTNLVIYLTRVMGAEPGAAAVQLNLFEGTCYLTPLLGAWLADSAWGRYRTILVFSVIYLVGMVALAASAALPGLTPPPDRFPTALQSAALYGALYIVALGTGGIKPNVSAFGADQFDENVEADRRAKASFFNWFYMAINIGSLAAVTGVVWVQENVSWAVGFAVPAAAMAAAVCVFVAGAGRYRHVPPAESPLARVWKVVRAAARARRAARPPPPRADEAGLRAPLLAPDGTSSSSALLSSSATNIKLSWLDAAAAPPRPGAPPPFSRAQVEEVKAMARVLPVFFATILYWTVYMQMGSFFVVQGAGMDRRLALPGGRAFVVPAASLSVVNTLAIVALIPLYDRLLVPALRRAGRPMTHLRRIGWGLAVAAAAMAAAAAVEARRLALFRAGAVIGPADAPPPGGDGLAYGFSASTSGFAGSAGGFAGGFSAAAAAAPQLLDPAPPSAVVAMSIWWQAPQYLLVGLSEVFASIGQMELFYDQAPAAMRSCSMALQLLSVCLGSYLSGALVYALAAGTAALDPARLGWLPKDLNAGRLDLFFWAMAALCLADLAAFLWVAASYEYKVDVVRPAVAAVAPPAAARPPPGARPPAAPLAAAAASRAHPRASPSMYGRSISVLPQTPAMPAPFR